MIFLLEIRGHDAFNLKDRPEATRLKPCYRIHLSYYTHAHARTLTVEMAAVENLRTVINERLTEAVEDILGVFTRTLSVYEEEICRQRTLLDIVLRPEIKLHRTGVYRQY